MDFGFFAVFKFLLELVILFLEQDFGFEQDFGSEILLETNPVESVASDETETNFTNVVFNL